MAVQIEVLKRGFVVICGILLICSGCGQQAVEDAKESMGDAASDMADAASDAAGDVGDAAGDAAEAAGEAAGEMKVALGEGFTAAMENASTALKDVEGGGEMLTKLKDLFASAQESLAGVKDSATAEAAVSKLNALVSSTEGISGMMEKLPEEAKTAVSGLVGQGIEGLKALVEKVMAIPGVKEKLEPAVEQLMAKLQGMVGAAPAAKS